jgi:hypothetical protein
LQVLRAIADTLIIADHSQLGQTLVTRYTPLVDYILDKSHTTVCHTLPILEVLPGWTPTLGLLLSPTHRLAQGSTDTLTTSDIHEELSVLAGTRTCDPI